MGDEDRVRRPLSTEQFAGLRRGQDIEDRQGRIWIVTGDPYPEGREWHVVLRSGDLVRVERQRFADEYALIAAPSLAQGLRTPAGVR